MRAEFDPISVEYFFRRLLGQSAHHMVNALQSDRVWRGFLQRSLRHLRRYVEGNVPSTDSLQRDRFELLLSALEERARMRPSLLREQALVTGLLELSLDLLGGAPDHRERQVVNKEAHFTLNRYRTLHYSQSVEQRARVIALACDSFPLPRGLSADDARAVKDHYWRAIYPKRRHAAFVTWFRTEYPEAYSALSA